MTTIEDTLLFNTGLEVDFDEDAGRRIIADRAFAAGETIIVLEPYACVVVEERIESVCAYCYGFSDDSEMALSTSCSLCGYAYYCDDNCRSAHEIKHSRECPLLSALQKSCQSSLSTCTERTLAREVIAILCRRHAEVNDRDLLTESERQSRVSYSCVLDLVSHHDIFPPHRLQMFSNIQSVLGKLLPRTHKTMDIPNEIEVLLCKEHCNAFALHDHATEEIAVGLFPNGGLFNHSCTPNMAKVRGSKGDPLPRFRAIRDIAEGEELTLTYVNLDDDPTTRNDTLNDSWFFCCSCEACQDMGVMEDFVGQYCHVCHVDDEGTVNRGLYVPPSPGQSGPRICNHCNASE